MASGDLTRLADVPIDVEVELDRRTMTVRQILDLEVGSLIGTARSAGENIDIYIGGALVGFGEIVVIENTMGVRVTDFQNEE
jgi:flagellar motor switch protein FliN/FliY